MTKKVLKNKSNQNINKPLKKVNKNRNNQNILLYEGIYYGKPRTTNQ